jgi:hypothetical protein
MKTAVIGLCSLTLLAVAYLTVSVLVLRPPRANLSGWFPVAAVIAIASMASIAAAAQARAPQSLRLSAVIGAVILFGLGIWMIRGTLQSPHFEGYQLLLGAMLIVQGVLTGIGLQAPTGASRPW